MTARVPPGSAQAAPDQRTVTAGAPPRTPTTVGPAGERARIRLFVAAHLAAVCAVYLAATWLGDGLAPPPFPPDLTSAQRHALLAPPEAADAGASTAPTAAAIPVGPAIANASLARDLDPPWARGTAPTEDTPR